MSDLLIIATSLNPQSRSQALARIALEEAAALGIHATLLDLREHPLPLAGGSSSWKSDTTQQVRALVEQHQRFIFAAPVYNYALSANTKNFLELCGDSIGQGSIAGFMLSAGGKAAYMSALGLINSLMLDFRVWVAPRFVYTTQDDWESGDWHKHGINAEVRGRIQNLLRDVSLGPATLQAGSSSLPGLSV